MRVTLTVGGAGTGPVPYLVVPIQTDEVTTLRVDGLGSVLEYRDGLYDELVRLGRSVDGSGSEGWSGLAEHVAADVSRADPLFDDELDHQNPLGRVDVDGPLELFAPTGTEPPGEVGATFVGGDWPTVRWYAADERWWFAESLAPDGFVVALPPGTTGIEVDLSDELDALGWSGEDDASALADDDPDVADRVRTTFSVHWRAYVGNGTDVEDGIDVPDERPDRPGRPGIVRIAGRATEYPGILCGRLVRRAARGAFPVAHDPLRGVRDRRRRARFPGVAEASPDLSLVEHADQDGVAVVAVHGTNASAIPMAAALSARATAWSCVPVVYRYEHDTWRGIDVSAGELARRVDELGLRRVVLVGHSRGGIVALLAAARLRRGPAPGGRSRDVRVVTWGAPFGGTPLVGAAEVARRGVNAAIAAFGFGGVVLLEIADRAFLRGMRHSLPDGIRDLREGSPTLGVLRLLADDVPAVAVAGDHPERGLRHGFFTRLYDGGNDRVVSVESAHLLGTRGAAVTIGTDHFTYETDGDALAPVDEAVAELCRAASDERRAEQRRRDAERQERLRQKLRERGLEQQQLEQQWGDKPS